VKASNFSNKFDKFRHESSDSNGRNGSVKLATEC